MKKIFINLGLGVLLGGLLVMPVSALGSHVVLPSSLAVNSSSWYFYDDVANVATANQLAGKYEFATSAAPSGVGSLEFNVIGTERWNMATAQFMGTKISDLSSLKFNTYQPSTNPGNSQYSLYLNFDVDFDGPGGNDAYQGRLVYVPRMNGTVNQDNWQEWSALESGSLWSWSRFAGNGNKWYDNNTSVNRTWDDIVASFPDATVSGQLLFRAGEPYPAGFKGNLDLVSVGIAGAESVYDFEPSIAPVAKDDCKKENWKNFNDPGFKNQGDCVSYIANKGNGLLSNALQTVSRWLGQ